MNNECRLTSCDKEQKEREREEARSRQTRARRVGGLIGVHYTKMNISFFKLKIPRSHIIYTTTTSTYIHVP